MVRDKGKTSREVTALIEGFPPEVRKLLKQMRRVIREIVPEADELIAYGIPSFRLGGRYLVHFAGFKKHIGFFPTSSGVRAFRKELAHFKVSTGTIQFRLDRPLPLALVKRIVRFRVKEERARQMQTSKVRAKTTAKSGTSPRSRGLSKPISRLKSKVKR